MATITFDTLKFVKKLEAAGIPASAAEAIAEAFREASGEADLVTKKDLQIGLAPIHADLTLLKWLLGILLGGRCAYPEDFFPDVSITGGGFCIVPTVSVGTQL